MTRSSSPPRTSTGSGTKASSPEGQRHRPIEKVLIANRGEIAVRILRTAKALGYRTVAVASTVDRDSLHARLADQVVILGPGPADQSYLRIDRILDAALRTGADAIHPGYGFLSENPELARACAQHDIVFVGPSALAIESMGNKAAAKRLMIEAGVPCVPGYQDSAEGTDRDASGASGASGASDASGSDLQSDSALIEAAESLGFPLMVKAAAGGGGRGLRRVEVASQLVRAIERARSEALQAFGSDELILERAIERPRHVEIQIIADSFGHTLHLGERDCSVQRRHQKVIEESPCPVMTPGLREAMGRAAKDAARSIGYCGVGTVEFMLDQNDEFYFLEMNTRLQVEHPVTEAVTGLDLVAFQFQIAEGRPLGLEQRDIEFRGHAIEARLYAEDPAHVFLPQSGTVHGFVRAPGVRTDTGIESGSEISPFYDPLIAKVIAWGETREQARRRLVAALAETAVLGPITNRDFLVACLEHETFVAGEATTAFLDEVDLTRGPGALEDWEAAVAAVLDFEQGRAQALEASLLPGSTASHSGASCSGPGSESRSESKAESATSRRCSPLLNWTNSGTLSKPFEYSDGDRVIEVEVSALSPRVYRVTVSPSSMLPRADGGPAISSSLTANLRVEVLEVSTDSEPAAPGIVRRSVRLSSVADEAATSGQQAHDQGRLVRVIATRQSGRPPRWLHLSLLEVLENRGAERASLSASLRSRSLFNRLDGTATTTDAVQGGTVVAPMHGLLLEVFVRPGDSVSEGERLGVMEAMKMQHEVTSPKSGIVREVAAPKGTQVAADDVLFIIEPLPRPEPSQPEPSQPESSVT